MNCDGAGGALTFRATAAGSPDQAESEENEECADDEWENLVQGTLPAFVGSAFAIT